MNVPLDCYDTLPCLPSNFENSVDDQYLNQLVDGFKIENLITYVEYAEHYVNKLKDDAIFCLERDWAKYGREDDFKRRLNTEIQQKEMLHLNHFLEYLDFIQDTKKYTELDELNPYSLQKTRPEWKVDGLSSFFNERMPKIQQNLKETIELKREFIPRIPKITVVASQTIERNQVERIKRVEEPEQNVKSRPSNNTLMY